MSKIPREFGAYWVRIGDRLIYTAPWTGASSLESEFRNTTSVGVMLCPFIEYVHFPWSGNAIDAAKMIHAADGRLDTLFFELPPRATLIRATVCSHPNPQTLMPFFRSVGITDVFLPATSQDLVRSFGLRTHPIASVNSIEVLNKTLRTQLKTQLVVSSDRSASTSVPSSERHAGISPTGKGLYIFTAAAFNYFPKAKLLSISIRKHLPEAHLCMALSDVRPAGFDIKKYGFDSVIAADDLNEEIPNLESWIFRHDVMELSTAIKPFVLSRLLALPDCKAVFFLDPDCYMFNHPASLIEYFNNHSILITPHQTKAETDDRMMFREINHLRFGIYNLGFLGVKNDDEGRRFATWWQKRLSKYCQIDLQSGLFTDQRWIDHVPVFFNRVKILRESVYNVACWNFRDRLIQGDPSQLVTADGLPICFFHFAGTTGGFQKYMEWWGNDKQVLKRLLDWYLETTKTLDNDSLFTRNPPYDYYANGEPVCFLHRLVYREDPEIEKRFLRPYSDVGPDSFLSYVSELKLPEYTRSDLLFGSQGKLLFHIKKAAEYTESMRSIQKESELIDHAQSKLSYLIS